MIVGSALKAFVAEIETLEAFDYSDKPDFRIRSNNRDWSCECAQIVPNSVLRYMHARFKQLSHPDVSAIQVVWPLEPHTWLRNIVQDKAKKLEAYKKHGNSDEVCLIVHEPTAEKDKSLRYGRQGVLELLRQEANERNGGFRRIYLWTKTSGVEILYPLSHYGRVTVNMEGGYPTDGFLYYSSPFRTTEKGADPVTYDYGILTPEVIIVPPITPEYRKRKPNYKIRKMRSKITAYEYRAEVTSQNIDVEPDDA